MKKMFLFLSIVLMGVMISCKEEPEKRTEQSFHLGIVRMEKNDSITKEVVPEFSAAWLFEAADFDFDASLESMENEDKMTLKNGDKVEYKYRIERENQYSLLFKDIKNGEYYIFAFCPINANTADLGEYSFGYKRVTVNDDIHYAKIFMFAFTDNDRLREVKPFVEK